MPSPVTIRPATIDDHPAIDRLGRAVQSDHAAAHPNIFRAGTTPIAIDRLNDLLATPQATVLVAVADECILGFVVLERREVPDYPVFQPRTLAIVEVLAVDPAARGAGVGRLLMEGAHTWAREQGAATLDLSVFEFNTNAIGFYEHLGFTTLRRTMTIPVETSGADRPDDARR